MRKLLTFICTLLVAIGASATINRNLHASVVLEKKTTTENELNLSTVGIRQTIIGEVEMADEPTMEEWNAEYVAKQQKAAAEYAAHDYYFVEGMLHSGYTPQFYSLSMPLIMLPFTPEVVWANAYGPTDWYMQHNDELLAENSETLTADYGVGGMYYLPYTTDHTLEQDGETYNIKGYMYAEAKGKGGAAVTTGYTPITISTGENIPMTLCGMETSTMNNENGSDFYKIGANSLDCPYAYGTNLYADVEHTLRVDTIISTVRNVSPLKINAINIPIYNVNGTTMIPKNGEIKIEIFAADLTMGMIYTDSILATAVATIDNFQEFQTGMGTIVATFQEEDKFGGMMDVSIVVEGDFVVQVTGYNESGCDFGIYADYYTPGGTTMYKVGGKYTPIFSKSSNLAIMYDAYWPVAIASLSQEVLVAPVEGGVALDGEYSAFAIYTNVADVDEAWVIDEEATSEWLEFSLDDSNLETADYLIGQITAEALPVGMTGRKGAFVIDVDGYKLSIPVIQGDVSNPAQTTITYELNGGVTNDDNWLSKGDMWTAFCADAGITLGTLEEVTAAAYPFTTICTPLAKANAQAILDNAKWDWLETYVMTVQNADTNATALVEGTSSAGWRYAFAAFFLESQHTGWPKSTDFSVAGTPEAFQPAWKHGFANPTKPTNTFVLNAPYKEGARFDGWYATADFSGAKVTKINVTTTGTLYAKWKSISQLASITVRSDDTSKGTVTGGGTYNVDNYAVLRATAKTGYHFSRWNDGNIQNPRIVKVTEDKTYTAYFESISTIAQNDTVYYINFKESMGSWSIDDKVKPEAVSTIWQQTALYGMKASAYVGGVSHVTESWFVSAPLNLTSCTNLNMEFNQVLNHATPDYVSVKITKDGTNWETLTVPNLPTGNNWTFVQSGVIDISSYISDKTQIAFVYTSDDVTAGTWEFDWILLSGDGTRITDSAVITAYSNDISQGTVTGGGTYNIGDNAILKAIAHDGYHFSHWNDGNTQNPRTIKVNGDKTYTAHFERNSTITQNDTVYYINFKESMGSWSIDDKVKPEAVSTIWQQTALYGMKASAYVGGVSHVTESWFVSAPLNLTSCTNLNMEFNQALNYATPDYVSVKITKDGANWETLTVPNLPTGNNWTFVQSGVIDISSYISDKTQIAFVYTSDDVTAGTWEFDWVLLSGDGTRIVEPEKPAEHISLADFVAKADPTTRYEVTATVSKMVDNYYGNFWITDGTHEVYVYGLTYGDQNRNVVDSFNIETGDEITLSGMYLWYTNASGESCVELLNGRFVGVKSANNVPTKADLADYYEPGQLCVCVYFEEEVCSDIVFAGSYNGWDTDPANMAKFAPLEGFNGWYYVAVTDESEEIQGKPVQLKKDGSFSWDYQTGDPASWTIVSGTVNISAGYDAEADLKGYSTAEPVILISNYFKNHNSPCIAEVYTYTLTVKSNNSSMGTVSGSGVYEEGENVQISATPHYGYHFSHWNDYNYDNPRQVQVTEDKIYTAYFYKNTYTIFVDYNSTYGTVTGPTSGEYQDEITLTATPNIGYEFVEWSDGVKDNSRTIVLNEDIYLSAYFAQAYSGQCGDNLYWKYDSESQTIAITGSGEMYHYTSSTQPWILFKEQIRKVEISNDATSLGTSAFEGCRSLGEVHIGLNLLDIYENVFAGCRRLYHIYSYPTYPPFADITSFANYSADVHIPCESYEWYVRDEVWGQFNIKCLGAEAEDVPTGEVTTTTTNTSVTITWPTDENADSYTIEIKKGDMVFCTLTFSKDGQLTNIAFAPSKDGQHRAKYAESTTKGLRFTVTSLDSGTRYGYDITTKNENDEVIDSYSGEFTTKSDVATDIDNVTATDNTVQKLLRDNQLLILRNGNTYNVMGAEVE